MQPQPCAGPVSRRSFLELGASSICGLGLGGLMQAQAASAARADAATQSFPDTSVIFVWLPGGPPHMEMYDMKPDAPSDYRGVFSPIKTNVPGMEVCELFPLHAKCADKYNIIRSIAHEFADHGGGHKRFLTGRKPATPTGFVNDAPMVGSIAAKALEGKRNAAGLPKYIGLIRAGRDQIDTFSFGAAYLGSQTHPFIVNKDPNAADFKVDNIALDPQMSARLGDRAALLDGFDRLRRDVDASGLARSMDVFNQRALAMMTSPQVRDAFDLSKEKEQVRDRYGRHPWGQRALLARRLVEAGASWVTVEMENPYDGGIPWLKNGTYNWDSHAVNCHIFDDARVRFPLYDKVVTALVEDLHARGLNRRVLLVVTGEFGRTPRLNVQTGTQTGIGQPGRDHWPQAMSMLVSGGGMRTGQVIGATNAKGEHPIERAMTPNDLWATVFQHLGIDLDLAYPDLQGRPMPILPFGEPIPELLPVT